MNLINCHALNENVTGTLSTVNRLIGTVNNGSNLTVVDCFAWENMTGKTFVETNSKTYGSNLTSLEIWNTFPDGKWTGWSASVWAANDYIKFRLPVPSWTNKTIQADAVHLMPAITLTYNGNGYTTGSDTVPVDDTVYPKPSESGYPKNATVKNEGEMKKEGFVFEKWTTESDGAGIIYMPGDEIEMTETLTLYAQWKESGKTPGGNSGGSTGSATITGPKPVQPEGNAPDMPDFENETIKGLEIIKPFLALLFFLLAIAVFLLVKRRRDEEEEEEQEF